MEENAQNMTPEKEAIIRKKLGTIQLFSDTIAGAKLRAGDSVSLLTRNNKRFDVSIQHIGSESILLGIADDPQLRAELPGFKKSDIKAAGCVLVKKVKGEYAVLQVISANGRGVLCCPHPRNPDEATYTVGYERIIEYWPDLESAQDACSGKADVTFYEMTVPGESHGYMFS